MDACILSRYRRNNGSYRILSFDLIGLKAQGSHRLHRHRPYSAYTIITFPVWRGIMGGTRKPNALRTVARVYPNGELRQRRVIFEDDNGFTVNVERPREYWDYENLAISWG